MNTKIILPLVIIILIAGGGYYLYTNDMISLPNQEDANNQDAGQVPQENVQAQDTAVGTGEEATPGSIVSVLYEGTLEDGTVFDSSAAHTDPETGEVPPLTFQLGTPGIIVGFQVGVNGMREEGERRVIVPPSLGYGAQDVTDPEGNVVIPANSTLTFDIKLINVEEAPAEAAPAPEGETAE